MRGQKPRECLGCTLYEKGNGFAKPVGPLNSALCFVGEALGWTEAKKSEPFVGDAGVYLNRAFRRLGIEREQVRIGNTVSCQPPNDWLVGSPWEQSAIAQCYAHRRHLLQHHNVFVTLGVTATRTVLKEVLNIDYAGKLDHWHGYVLGDSTRGYVVPTYHPAFLLRGNQKLFGTFLFDLTRAMETASFGHKPSEVSTLEDPTPATFADFVNAVPDDPAAWLAADIETPVKQGGDEDDMLPGQLTQPIRISFAYNGEQGVSVPWEPRYHPMIRNALATKCAKIFHNERYDVPILEAAGFPVNGTILDSMWAWHFLQSDVPKSLGFVAPFYSTLPPWKHLSNDRPAYYSALDSVQTYRIMSGIAKDLVKQGQWEAYLKYCVRMDQRVLHPMTQVGVHMSKDQLKTLEKFMEEKVAAIKTELTALYPKEIIPHAGGWKRQPPVDSPYHHSAFKQKVTEEVLVCMDCGAADVGPKHKCKKEKK